jgi:hypothetical protein
MLLNVERAVLARVGLTDRVDDAGTGAHDGTG